MPAPAWAESRSADPAGLWALASCVSALEPDLLVLAERVRVALVDFERRFDIADPADAGLYESMREASGAAQLFEVLAGLADAFSAAATGLSGPVAHVRPRHARVGHGPRRRVRAEPDRMGPPAGRDL